ncbi:NADAR family protein [Rapidithrix thailandica]|uniref:NADAR family protein n=1 Tax=Rapidithrix thailandica TaxID=413964 RepID=A0AAW9S6X0_9BACT
MKYDIHWLINQQQKTIKYLFFWGHQPAQDGSISASCLSQWWQASFIVEGISYPTAEHWMMAEKARLFKDMEILEKIIRASGPAEAKKLGRKVKNFDQHLWEAQRYDIVKEGNFHKFSQHPTLKTFLLGTVGRVLVEASPVDRIWGIGMAKRDKGVENPEQWKGLNLLGFALMEVREMLSGSTH